MHALLPPTSDFLRALLDALVRGRFSAALDWLLDDLTDALARTRFDALFRDAHEPFLRFYERFLDAYDPALRERRGVYYTPDAAASYVVRATDRALREVLGLPLGLADTTTWRAYAAARGVEPPAGVDVDAPLVQVLDPALGTGAFLVRVLDVARETMTRAWAAEGRGAPAIAARWREHLGARLLPRLAGFEVMLAPYVVAHLRLGLQLAAAGFRFGPGERLRLFLTDALDPWAPPATADSPTANEAATPGRASRLRAARAFRRRRWRRDALRQASRAALASRRARRLAAWMHEEARRAHQLKRDRSITVVLGNPPYGSSARVSAWSRDQVTRYRELAGRPLRLAQGKWLLNDYVRFLAHAERRILDAGVGALGFITDHSYLDGDTFPGLRHSLLTSFSRLWALDLHGNLKRREAPPGAAPDENVFEIQQGVAVLVAARGPQADGLGELRVAELWGARADKLARLARDGDGPRWTARAREGDRYLFVRPGAGAERREEFARFDGIDDLFSGSGRPAPGFLTTHDELAIAFTHDELAAKVAVIVESASEAAARARLTLCRQPQWSYARAKAALREGAWREAVRPCLYRPFDRRWTAYDPNVLVHRRARVSQHLLAPGNLALLTTRVTKGDDFAHVFITDVIAEVICLSSKTSANAFVFPLYLGGSGEARACGLDPAALAGYAALLGTAPDPRALLAYVYALLHSPSYRARYNGLLVRQLPRVPRPRAPALFDRLARLGHALIDAHLLRSAPAEPRFWLAGDGAAEVAPRMPRYDEAGQRARINPRRAFTPVPPAVWAFKVGGYAVCRKWLAARRGRALTPDEVSTFRQVLWAISLTLRVQAELDAAIAAAGGWPGAFQAAPGDLEA
ncbi:MAG: hypothetical protein H6713_25635 [Myxococcales bacterium]|nr:hypothetical protein [Myxococcales bacterium]